MKISGAPSPHSWFLSGILSFKLELPWLSWTLIFVSLIQQDHCTLVGLLLPAWGLEIVSRRNAGVIIKITSFVSLLLGKTVLHCWLSIFWKQLLHILSSFLVVSGGRASLVVYSGRSNQARLEISIL